jgi:hypothetical protein
MDNLIKSAAKSSLISSDFEYHLTHTDAYPRTGVIGTTAAGTDRRVTSSCKLVKRGKPPSLCLREINSE